MRPENGQNKVALEYPPEEEMKTIMKPIFPEYEQKINELES